MSKCPTLNKQQTEMVKRHLALVFKHEIDPSYGGDSEVLQAIHDGNKPPKNEPSKPHLGPFHGDDGPVLIRC